MTQIKLRRDTSANFNTANPVLGSGEPAYETDTKKLKIGDGTTAYNSLAYFAGGGGSAEFNVVQPLKLVDGTLTLQIDEQTIQVQNGKLVANLDELGNEVNDLSGRVTAAEADLIKKQDKLTAGANITIDTNNVISSTGGANAGLEGDYCSKYGIVDCPNGILVEGTNKVTLKAGVVMQMTETDGLTTNASDMAHDITSTTDFDLFYTSGSLLEATQVVFSENEPDNGSAGVLAWYNGTKWQFKSNDTGNVWKSAPAVRLAYIHITDGNITRIDYIGNRHLNKVIPVTTNSNQIITGSKTFKNNLTAYYPFTFNCLENNARFDITYNQKSSNLVTTTPLMSFSLDEYSNDIRFGVDNTNLQLIGKLKDEEGNKILTQGNVTAGDNVTITNTTGGIQISATGGTSNALDVDLSNISATGKSKASGYALLSDTSDNLTLGASGSTYIAPANGYIYICGVLGAGYVLVCINSTDNTNVNTARSTAKNVQGMTNTSNTGTLSGNGFTINVNRGDTASIWYDGVQTFEASRFIYAKGEVE